MRRPYLNGFILFVATAVASGTACEPPAQPVPAGGELLWTVATDVAGMQPAFDSANVYFGSFRHQLIAVDRRSGALRWRTTMVDAGGFTTGFDILPVAGLVIAIDRGVRAFDSATGEVRWSFAPSGAAAGAFGTPTDGRTLYATAPQGPVYALDVVTGALRWETRISPDTRIGTHGVLLHEGILYLGFTRNLGPLRGGVAALSAIDGTVLWTTWLPPVDSTRSASGDGMPAVSGDLVFMSMGDGRIHALDRGTGVVRPTVPEEEKALSTADIRSLVVAQNLLIASSTSGWLSAYRLSDGVRTWHATQARGSFSGPITTDGTSVFAIAGGELASFDASSGTIRWRATGAAADRLLYAATPSASAVYANGSRGGYALRK